MNNIVKSKRIIYTPSDFAKKSLLYLQEIGQSKSLKKHTSSREYLDSFLLFIVLDGNGELKYNKKTYKLSKGNIVFIDCKESYSHTSDNWYIKWIHFNGNNIKDIYNKYLSRDGKIVFVSSSFNKYDLLIDDINLIAKTNDYTADMQIYEKITSLLLLLMSETIHPSKNTSKQKYNIKDIKDYLDIHYLENITLDSLSSIFYINKYYLTRLFKDTYSITITDYINKKIITKAKELLRFSDYSIEQISSMCNISDSNYFSRLFKKVEGITPKEYRKRW